MRRRSWLAQGSLLDTVLKRDKLSVANSSTSLLLAHVEDTGKLVGFEVGARNRGRPEEILFAPRTERVRAFLKRYNDRSHLRTRPHIL
jgi:hypothetical protein